MLYVHKENVSKHIKYIKINIKNCDFFSFHLFPNFSRMNMHYTQEKSKIINFIFCSV